MAKRKKARETLQKAYNELERRFQERTVELEKTNMQLKQEIEIGGRTEAALRESENKCSLLIRNLHGVVFKSFGDGSVSFIDEKVEVLTGYDIDEFNSKKMKWFDIIEKEDLEDARKIFSEALKTGNSYVLEYRIKSKTGVIHWIQERGQIVCDNRGEIEYINGVFFDITERRLIQREKDRMKMQLRQAQKIQAIAHEFNNALGAIIGNAELMELFDIPVNSPIRSRLKGVLKGAYRAKDLVQQILTLKSESEQHRSNVSS